MSTSLAGTAPKRDMNALSTIEVPHVSVLACTAMRSLLELWSTGWNHPRDLAVE